ncbi:MAG TPA: NAD(P)(+) transhydrogenase (Re/Si-specific) subunit beta [Gammaproteobacteria bacterium]|nr:NAD(P)(+) transhydrogenase (Re/Si-specific) subunit beta [Gammaproteobacteria bacterium]
MSWPIQLCYFVAAVLFILGLKAMSSPKTARRGVQWAGAGMLVAVLATFFYSGMHHYILMIVAIVVGGAVSWYAGRKVAMTAMPQMVAIYNGMGGGAAAAIAAVELYSGHAAFQGLSVLFLAVLGALIGAMSFSGSSIAFAKLQGWMKKMIRLPGQHLINGGLLAASVILGLIIVFAGPGPVINSLFFIITLILGVLVTMPIGGADMPVVISLYNALTGLAVSFEGFALHNPAMIIAGMVVGAAGSLLTLLMARAMNRSVANVLFSGFGADEGTQAEGPEGEMKSLEASDAAISMAYSDKVIIVPGYGLAVAQAQHKLWEFVQMLQNDHDVEVKFAIHPVAGRMPGHMNVLLAEAGVPYDMIFDLEEVNDEFSMADYSLVVGANDVVNPAALNNKSSPIYGMPILNVDQSREVLVIKRGRGTGFSGVQNELFFEENTRMVFGDAQEVSNKMIQALKTL